jgi:hypothetical protein
MARRAVYAAIAAVTEDLSKKGIAKARTNSVDDYQYRSIDDLLNRLSPLLAKHRLCVLPRILEQTVKERAGPSQPVLMHASVRVAFDLVSAADGSLHTIEFCGEALDPSDKATAKALSAAYKSAMIQVFCIPVVGNEDADAKGYRVVQASHLVPPVQGWEQWCCDIQDIVAACASNQAVDAVQGRNLELLKTLRKERPELYDDLGRCFSDRRQQLGIDPKTPVDRIARRQCAPRTAKRPRAKAETAAA